MMLHLITSVVLFCFVAGPELQSTTTPQDDALQAYDSSSIGTAIDARSTSEPGPVPPDWQLLADDVNRKLKDCIFLPTEKAPGKIFIIDSDKLNSMATSFSRALEYASNANASQFCFNTTANAPIWTRTVEAQRDFFKAYANVTLHTKLAERRTTLKEKQTTMEEQCKLINESCLGVPPFDQLLAISKRICDENLKQRYWTGSAILPPPDDHSVYQPTCAVSSTSLVPSKTSRKKRMVGGHDAQPHSSPWLVMVLTGNGSRTMFCGGFLWQPDMVVTAAHCLWASVVHVIVGAHAYADVKVGEKRRVVASAIHEHFVAARSLDNDIALLRLDKPVELGPTARLLRLPEQDEHPEVGSVCLIAGWGRINIETGEHPSVLQEACISVIGDDECNHCAAYAGSLTPNMFCVRVPGDKISPAHGDSGGPLVCSGRNDTPTASGIASFISINKYASVTRAAVFTKVPNYITWLQENSDRLRAMNISDGATSTIEGRSTMAGLITVSCCVVGMRMYFQG